MNRFFHCSPQVYEASRAELDRLRGLIPPDTVIAPLDRSLQKDGLVFFGIRAQHCEVPDIAAALGRLIGAGKVTEITESEYRAAVPVFHFP